MPITPIDACHLLTPTDFELLCGEALRHLGFTSIVHRKSGSQSGRDIDAALTIDGNAERWFFECKNYNSGAVPFAEIVNKVFLIHQLVPRPDALVIIASNRLSNDTHDFLERFSEDVDYPIIVVAEEPPEFRFSSFLNAGGPLVHQRLAALRPSVAAPNGNATAFRAWLLDEKRRRRTPASRIERALRLSAYPRLDLVTLSTRGHWLEVDVQVTNIGSGFADRVRLVALHNETAVAHMDLPSVPVGGTVRRTVRPAPLIPDESRDNDKIFFVLDYGNALNQRFQISFVVESSRTNRSRHYSEARRVAGYDIG
ncbi:restriction endonuclease [Sorangium sp. So ce385]|uniref:restriction endonuclease n=1 Tax=Sorangium sp. So ce385 TaxID=3133308 RepID=UPI003F5B224D